MRQLERDISEDPTAREMIAAFAVLLVFIAPIVLWHDIYAFLGTFWSGVAMGFWIGLNVMVGLLAVGCCIGAGKLEKGR